MDADSSLLLEGPAVLFSVQLWGRIFACLDRHSKANARLSCKSCASCVTVRSSSWGRNGAMQRLRAS